MSSEIHIRLFVNSFLPQNWCSLCNHCLLQILTSHGVRRGQIQNTDDESASKRNIVAQYISLIICSVRLVGLCLYVTMHTFQEVLCIEYSIYA